MTRLERKIRNAQREQEIRAEIAEALFQRGPR